MVQEVILAHGLHVGADALADIAAKLLERHAFPLRGSLDNLGMYGFVESQPARKFHRCPRAVAIQVIINAAISVNDQRNLNHLQVEFLAQILLNVVLCCKDALHGFFRGKQGFVIFGQNLLQVIIIADSGSGQVCCFVCH